METDKKFATKESPVVRNLRYYSVNTIGIVSFFLGPLAGGYMLYENFLLLGDRKSAVSVRNTFLIGAIIFGIYLLLPLHIPTFLSRGLSVVLGLMVYFYAQKKQEHLLEEYAKNGGQKTSYWRDIAVSVGAFLVMLIYIFVVILIAAYVF